MVAGPAKRKAKRLNSPCSPARRPPLGQPSDFCFETVALGEGAGADSVTFVAPDFLAGAKSPDLASNKVAVGKRFGPVVITFPGPLGQFFGPAVPLQTDKPVLLSVDHSPVSPFLEGSQVRVHPLLNVFSLPKAPKVPANNSKLTVKGTIIFTPDSAARTPGRSSVISKSTRPNRRLAGHPINPWLSRQLSASHRSDRPGLFSPWSWGAYSKVNRAERNGCIRCWPHKIIIAGREDLFTSIRASRFLVADFSIDRGGIYFEAGYALGFGYQ
jgi:hypothetical protein